MLRSGFSLGGLGSGRIDSDEQLATRVNEVLKAVPQVLIEEYLLGWKEIEYEIVRDGAGNTIAVCNMENFDPMGIHTGESIVVAPSQTLTNKEYHHLREVALKTIDHLGIVGECNIQYALNPHDGDYRVIEVNARLSRSSALASKATGYPLAFVASKIMLGRRLHELKNAVTGKTSAFYEPALDYIAVKIPRWDLAKFKASDHHIGSEMKSVGEVMALGRSFPEALQKAIRMLNIGATGFTAHPYSFTSPLDEVEQATDRRLFALYEAMKQGVTVPELNRVSNIDVWFLEHIASILKVELRLAEQPLASPLLRAAKAHGFADAAIATITGRSTATVRNIRLRSGIVPYIKQIDTLAGEFAAETNYLYVTYHGSEHDITPLGKSAITIIGSGPYCIGSSVEFDWCAVTTAKTLGQRGHKTIIINSNPETVSTDFDRSDRLYFEELTLERIQDIADFEKSQGIIVSVGGQIANNVALPLARAGYSILGTTAQMIDRAEDRQKFSSMLNRLGVDQPEWQEVTTLKSAKQFAGMVGYPLLIRPSYVLSGGAMNVVWTEAELERYLAEATRLSPDHPVVVSSFIQNAKELEIDGVAQNGKLIIYAISEHIENAGIHSGDATVVYPAQKLYIETVRRAKQIAKQIVANLEITGPFNVQFIAKDNELKVIECNVRASRSFPFVSKVSGHNFIAIAIDAILDIPNTTNYQTLELDYVAVKTPQFSYNRLKGADPVAGVEMASTGEVACIGTNLEEAFYTSWLATEQQISGKNILISLPDSQKHKFLTEAASLAEHGWLLKATPGTYAYLKEHGVPCSRLYKIAQKKQPSVATAIEQKAVDLVVNIPSAEADTADAYTIRRLAIDNHIPLLTNAETARLLLRCLTDPALDNLKPLDWETLVR
jgi:carbamoyl-phosphate synthase large subunit